MGERLEREAQTGSLTFEELKEGDVYLMRRAPSFTGPYFPSLKIATINRKGWPAYNSLRTSDNAFEIVPNSFPVILIGSILQ